ncbi:MAG: hypothetical protein IJG50_06400 [Clostridia bacterium]|nr:hypothetical protein [Clostridia bacterium]
MCLYCFNSTKIFDDGKQCLCPKAGVVSADHSCRRYKYDPTKRIPPRRKVFSGGDIKISEI